MNASKASCSAPQATVTFIASCDPTSRMKKKERAISEVFPLRLTNDSACSFATEPGLYCPVRVEGGEVQFVGHTCKDS